MAFEIGETDVKISGTIIRLACGLVGFAGIVMIADGFVFWLRDCSAHVSIWNAIADDEPYCSFTFLGRSLRLGGGFLWDVSPNGMLPALCNICFSCSALVAAVFNRLWMHGIAALLMILALI